MKIKIELDLRKEDGPSLDKESLEQIVESEVESMSFEDGESLYEVVTARILP